MILACSVPISLILFACQEKSPKDHEEIVRAGLAEILSHQETGCEEVISWEIDSRFDYLVRCANDMKFRIHVGSEGHVNVEEHLQATSLRPFDETFESQGLTFRVQCDNNSSLNTITVTPSGLEIDNSTITAEADGIVVGAEIADLNQDLSPEIYVYVTSAGSGSYGSLAAWSSNNKKSLSPIYLPEIADDPDNGEGYMGHDEFAVVDQHLVRRFPIYLKDDPNAAPSGGTRQLQYILEAGEAGWKLVPHETTDYQ